MNWEKWEKARKLNKTKEYFVLVAKIFKYDFTYMCMGMGGGNEWPLS
jgi:hypothetical protein